MGWNGGTVVDRPGGGTGAGESHLCAGWPTGYTCIVFVADSIWCTDCRVRRQEAYASGVPVDGMVPVGIILEDFTAPQLVCRCGGDPEAIRHIFSLRHMEWAWKQPDGSTARGHLPLAPMHPEMK